LARPSPRQERRHRDRVKKAEVIDPDLIPVEICSRQGIHQLTELLARLRSRKVDYVALPEPESAFRGSNLLRAYSQAYLRRCLSLFESAYKLFFTENVLVSLICVRAIFETVAAFCHFERQLQALLATSDLGEIFEFVKAKAHVTRISTLLRQHGDSVKATSILTEISKLATVRPEVAEEYEFLSEITHPNALGVYHFFAAVPDQNDVVTFSDGGRDRRADLKWMLVGCHMLEHFEAALIRIETELPGLSQKGREQSPHLMAKPSGL
jgi:hypothetical protein